MAAVANHTRKAVHFAVDSHVLEFDKDSDFLTETASYDVKTKTVSSHQLAMTRDELNRRQQSDADAMFELQGLVENFSLVQRDVYLQPRENISKLLPDILIDKAGRSLDDECFRAKIEHFVKLVEEQYEGYEFLCKNYIFVAKFRFLTQLVEEECWDYIELLLSPYFQEFAELSKQHRQLTIDEISRYDVGSSILRNPRCLEVDQQNVEAVGFNTAYQVALVLFMYHPKKEEIQAKYGVPQDEGIVDHLLPDTFKTPVFIGLR